LLFSEIQHIIVGHSVGQLKMATKELSDREVQSKTKRPGVHRVAAGLYLRVRDTGAAYWMLRYSVGDKSSEMSLGTFSMLTLAEAKHKASDLRLSLKRDGIDPLQAKRISEQMEKGKKFREVAEALIEDKRHAWKNAKHAGQWVATLNTYAYPIIGDLDVATIDTEHVLSILKPIWTEKHETATRLRQRVEAVMDAATARKLRSGENPARWKGHLDKLLSTIPKIQRVKHHPAMLWQGLPAFMDELRQRDNISARALGLAILSATRTSEVTGAQWNEFDLDGATWIIPKNRMKAKREHRVALSSQAVDLLRSLPRVKDEQWVFPGARVGRPLSNMAMLELLRGMRPGLTVHGFRSTFRDWVGEATSFSPELAEHALAHVVGNQTEAAYRRGDALERRRELMQAWAGFAYGTGKVIQLVSNAA
jgi:integrase